MPLNRSDIHSFYIFLSQILYPTATLASEADMLLLIPIYLRIAPETVNAHLREFTPLSLAAFNNYLRAANLLLRAENIDVNDSHCTGTPLEQAIERGHLDMVSLLLTHPNIEITAREEELAQGNVEIQGIIEKHKAERKNEKSK